VLDGAPVDDSRPVPEFEGRDGRGDLFGARRRGDRPGHPGGVEPREKLAGAWQGLRVAVALVEQRARPLVDLRSGRIVAEHLGREAAAIHPDHRLQPIPAEGDPALGKRRLPRLDPCADRVDERAVEVEDDRVGPFGRWHRSYDTEPMPSELAVHWTLDPAVRFLNHGSFGATPRVVLEAQGAWRARMEREPVAFFARDLEPAFDEARVALGTFLGADPEDLAFVTNATTGINIVARSIRLEPGDELVLPDHAYPAARNALQAVADAAGARLVTASIPFPGATPEEARDAMLAALTGRTRLVMLDHVTSPTALVLPVAEIVAALEERGIDTLVDAAHAPGMVEIDLDAIGAAYTAGNCHKWMCAPKGSAFLHVRRDRRDRVRPLVVSHGASSMRSDRTRFRLEHDWTGTLDPTPWLSVPAAIAFGDGLLLGGWDALRDRGRRLALATRALLGGALGEPDPAPEAMVGAMVAVPLPPTTEPVPDGTYADPVHAALLDAGIQVAVTSWPQDPGDRPWRRLVRVSCAPYVALDDVRALAVALPAAVRAA
jgi:isopenicillin-N epimerase